MPSPICEVSIDGGAYQSTTDGVNATPSRSVKIRLIDASASTWSIACITTDNSSDADAITAALVIDPIQKTAEFTPDDAGTALRFRSEVNNGRDSSGRSQPSYATTFCIYTLTANGARVISLEETTEGDSRFGWIAPVNDLIRSGGGGGGGGGEANTSSNVGAGAQLAKAKVGVNLPFRTIVGSGNIAATQNTDDVTLSITGTIPTGNQAAQTMVGDVTGTTAASVVSKVRGAAVGTAAGALTTGQSLRVTGASAADWGAIDLANANATTGTLAVAKQAAPTSTGVAKVVSGVWASAASLVTNADVSASAAIDVSKLAASVTNGKGLVTVSGVPTWATVVTEVALFGGGAHVPIDVTGGAIRFRSLVQESPIVVTQGSIGITIGLGTVSVAKGGTGLTTIGGSNTVLTSNGTAAAWATIVDANVSSSAALTWSKFAGGTQEVKPTAFNFTGLTYGRPYQRSFDDALVVSGESMKKTYTIPLPDNATTKVTVESEFLHSANDTFCGSVTREVVVLRRGASVTILRNTLLLTADSLHIAATTSGTNLVIAPTIFGNSGSGRALTVLDIKCVSSSALPSDITVTVS